MKVQQMLATQDRAYAAYKAIRDPIDEELKVRALRVLRALETTDRSLWIGRDHRVSGVHMHETYPGKVMIIHGAGWVGAGGEETFVPVRVFDAFAAMEEE